MQIFNYNKTYKLQIFIVKWGMNSTMIFLIKKRDSKPSSSIFKLICKGGKRNDAGR